MVVKVLSGTAFWGIVPACIAGAVTWILCCIYDPPEASGNPPSPFWALVIIGVGAALLIGYYVSPGVR